MRPSIELMVLARGQVFTFAVLLCESIPIGCDSRCQTFNYLIPTMDSMIEVVANLSIIRGDDFHTRKNRPLPECDSAVAALSQFLGSVFVPQSCNQSTVPLSALAFRGQEALWPVCAQLYGFNHIHLLVELLDLVRCRCKRGVETS